MTHSEYESLAFQVHNANAVVKAVRDKLTKLEGDERQAAGAAGYALSSGIEELKTAEYHLDKLAEVPKKKSIKVQIGEEAQS